MDCKVTFEDGSSACLEHFGTKGMKWGVWNAETAARYRGGDSSWKGTKKTAVAFNKADMRKAVEIGMANKNAAKASKYFSKAATADFKGNKKKADKAFAKGEKYAEQKKKHTEAAEGIEKHQQKLADQLSSSMHTVKMSEVSRSTISEGQQIIYGSLFGVAGSVGAYAASPKVRGQQVSVKRTADLNRKDRAPFKVYKTADQIEPTTMRIRI